MTTATFRCGHKRIPLNIKWKKRAGKKYKHRTGEYKKYQATCRICAAAAKAQASRRARERKQKFKDELYQQFPQDLPSFERC
jgi:hypothetical protein